MKTDRGSSDFIVYLSHSSTPAGSGVAFTSSDPSSLIEIMRNNTVVFDAERVPKGAIDATGRDDSALHSTFTSLGELPR